MKTALPTYEQFSTYSSEIGVNVPTEDYFDDLLEEVVDEWNASVGYKFFNLTETSSSKTYTFPSNLDGQLILGEYWSEITGVTVDGSTTTNYQLREGRELLFDDCIAFGAKVVITGVIGTAEFDTLVFRKLMDYMVYKYILANPTRVFESVEQMDVTLKMGKMRNASEEFERTALSYRW